MPQLENYLKRLLAPNNEEKNQTVIDLKRIEPIHDYATENRGDYTVGRKSPNVLLKAAEKTVLKQIVADRLRRNHAFDRFSQSFLEALNTMHIEGI